MQNLEAHDLVSLRCSAHISMIPENSNSIFHSQQFKIHALIQLRFVDPRLVFREVAPNRKETIMGEKSLHDSLWTPHIFLANERSSSILGTAEKDILTSVSPDGTIIISTRIQATLNCWMNLQKFPFDEQKCNTIFESCMLYLFLSTVESIFTISLNRFRSTGMYNTSELELHWEPKSPVTLAPELHLTEYVLLNMWTNETIINADLKDLRHGAFGKCHTLHSTVSNVLSSYRFTSFAAGNYSSLSFTVHLAREMGFYLMDYFLPSMMIVAISWVSFWLQADQSPPRIMLGTSTMLTFITLASAQGKTLPKVSYIKVSEVWFLGCTLFIFGSLVEFAFVNTIWRRKNNVELKKVRFHLNSRA